MKLVDAPATEGLHDRVHPTARSGVRALLVVEEGTPPYDAAEFLRTILPAESRVRLLTVRPYQFQPGSPWGTLAEGLGRPAGMDPTDYQITLRILEAAGAQVSSTARHGSAPDEILCEAADWGADLILLGHNNGLGRWFQGSVAENLLKKSVIPVVVVPQLSQAAERFATRAAGLR